MDYLEWNDRIAEKIFSPDRQDHPVLFTVTRELIEELGTFNDYLEACVRGPSWLKESSRIKVSLYERTVRVYEGWHERKLKYPPYLGYLGLMVIAEFEEKSNEGYYKALDQLIHPMVRGVHRYLQKITEEIWLDLETWSKEEQNGGFGLFEVFWVQDYIHVGLIKAQTLISPADISKLTDQFYVSDLDPSITPSSNELLKLATFVSPRLKAFVDTPGEINKNRELLETVLRLYFDKWDGQPTEDYSGTEKPRGTLLLSAQVNKRRRSVRFGLRAKTTVFEFPRDGFKLSKDNTNWVARPLKLDISNLIEKQDAEGETYQVTGDDLAVGLQLEERSSYPFIVFKLRPGSIRILTLGHHAGIEGWIEDSHAPVGIPFYFLVDDTDKNEIRKCEEDFEKLTEQNLAGIPTGWSLFHCKQVLQNHRLVRLHTCFREMPAQSAKLVGGIPARQGSRNFMYFGPPQLRLPRDAEKENTEIRVRWEGGYTVLGDINDQGVRDLPEGLPTDKQISVEQVDSEGQVHGLIEFALIKDSLELGRIGKDSQVDTFGNFLTRGHKVGVQISGGTVHGIECPSGEFNVYREFDRADKVIFLGANPKQFSEWPKNPVPKWAPVWVISFPSGTTETPQVAFSGASPEQCRPSNPDTRDPMHSKWIGCLKGLADVKFHTDHYRERELWSCYMDAAFTVWSSGTSTNTPLADALRKLKQ